MSATSDRVLIFTPRMRLYGQALASVYAMKRRYGLPVDTLEIQNDQPFGAGGLTGHDRQAGNKNVLYLYQRAREAFLAGPWTHMLCLEDDMIVPPDALDRLLAADAGVAYSLYCWRWGRDRDHLWSVYSRLYEDGGCSWAEDQPQTIARWAREGRVIDVAGAGLGCTLIRRDALERVPFRLGDPAKVGAANDWYFAVDCQAAGVVQRAALGVVCGHIRGDPSLRVIWPDLTAQRRPMARYEYIDQAAPLVEAEG